MQKRDKMILNVFLVTVMAGGVYGEEWSQWRGPKFNGSTTETNLPDRWTQTENVVWIARLPGGGGSTPIIRDDWVFITAQDGEGKTWAVGLNRQDGSVRWKHQIGTGFNNRQGNTAASPSPIADGKNVYFLFGSGDFVGFTKQGKELWKRNITEDHGEYEILWDYGSTGLLLEDKIYVPVIHGHHRNTAQDKSYILCVDPQTGKDIWKRDRHTDATYESKQAYTTPYPLEVSGQTNIYITGGDYITAHDPKTGKVLYRSETLNPNNNRWGRTVVSPVSVDGVMLQPAPRGGSIYAARLGEKGQISEWIWIMRQNSPDVCTPLAYRGKFYILNGVAKKLLCVAPHTGRVLGECDLEGKTKFQASPTGADGKIYCINMRGEAFVLSATDAPRILYRVDMDGKDCRSTIAIAGGQLFIRVDDRLYCIGKK
jgi:outer membrane protein assembly factor BamB